MALGMAALVTFGLLDLARLAGLHTGPDLFDAGLCLFAIGGMFLLVDRAQDAYDELATLRGDLEVQVRDRTVRLAERTRELEDVGVELAGRQKEVRRLQARLVHSEKMAALGQLVAGVAHEINNPVNFIASGVSSIRRDVDRLADAVQESERDDGFDRLRARIGKVLDAIESGAARTADTVRELRSFARLDQAEVKTIDPNEAIDTTLGLVRSQVPPGVTVDRDYARPLELTCRAGELNQVLLPLLTNAIQAFGADAVGRVWIKTRAVADDAIRIEVGDTGVGMPPEVLARVPEPFFSTRPGAAGLGLSTAQQLVQGHGGRLTVTSDLGVGTVVAFELPRRLVT
jgi:signal transduction histidine kinase